MRLIMYVWTLIALISVANAASITQTPRLWADARDLSNEKRPWYAHHPLAISPNVYNRKCDVKLVFLLLN